MTSLAVTSNGGSPQEGAQVGIQAVFNPPRALLQLLNSDTFAALNKLMFAPAVDVEELKRGMEKATQVAKARASALQTVRLALGASSSTAAKEYVLYVLSSGMKEIPGESSHYGAGLVGASREAVALLRESFQNLYTDILGLLDQPENVSDAVLMLAISTWDLDFGTDDHPFMQASGVFETLQRIMHLRRRAASGARGANTTLPLSLKNVTGDVLFSASSNEGMVGSVHDGSLLSFWEANGSGSKVKMGLPKPMHIASVAVAVARDDKASIPSSLTLEHGVHVDYMDKGTDVTIQVDKSSLKGKEAGAEYAWQCVPVDAEVGAMTLAVVGGAKPRIRQVVVLAAPEAQQGEEDTQEEAREDGPSLYALSVFEGLAGQVFGGLGEVSANLREQLVGMVEGVGELKANVLRGVLAELKAAVAVREEIDWAVVAGKGEKGQKVAARLAHESDAFVFQLVSMAHALSATPEIVSAIYAMRDLVETLVRAEATGTPRVQRAALGALRRLYIGSQVGVEPVLDMIARYVSVTLKGGRAVGYQDVFVDASPADESVRDEAFLLAVTLLKGGTEVRERGAFLDLVRDALLEVVDRQEEDMAALVRTRCLWQALGGLLVLSRPGQEDDLAEVTGAVNAALAAKAEAEGESGPVKVFCANHEDGKTMAAVMCAECDAGYCRDCDRFLHLPVAKREHVREALVDGSAFVLEIREGTARLKMSQLSLVVDLERWNGLVRTERGPSSIRACRFCGTELTLENEDMSGGVDAVADVCVDERCVRLKGRACPKRLECGHACCGVRNEETCLPCLTCGDGKAETEAIRLRQDGEDMCMICWTDPLSMGPCIQLSSCGHVFHAECLEALVAARWNGPRIDFGFLNCPMCKTRMEAPELDAVLAPLRELEAKMEGKLELRAQFMRLGEAEEVTTAGSEYYGDVMAYARHRIMYFLCSECDEPYFGGDYRCVAAGGGDREFDPSELVCGGCSARASGVELCSKHGAEYMVYKCRYCCAPSVWFCFGTTRFCDPCHNNVSAVQGIAEGGDAPKCPVGPVCTQLPDGPCPLGIKHPDVGSEFCMGCGLCKEMERY